MKCMKAVPVGGGGGGGTQKGFLRPPGGGGGVPFLDPPLESCLAEGG